LPSISEAHDEKSSFLSDEGQKRKACSCTLGPILVTLNFLRVVGNPDISEKLDSGICKVVKSLGKVTVWDGGMLSDFEEKKIKRVVRK